MTAPDKARELLAAAQPFERFPDLAVHIQRMASTGQTGSALEWCSFTYALNAALASHSDAAVEALEVIAEGGPERTRVTIYRSDGKPSKHDLCKHEIAMWNDCGECVSEFARNVLASLRRSPVETESPNG